MSGNQRPDNPASERTDWWWVYDPRLSLRARTVLIIGLGGLLFTALVVWTAGFFYRRSLSEHLGQGLENIAFQLNDKMNRAMREQLRELQLLATLPVMRASNNTAELRSLLNPLQASSREYVWMGFVNTSGTVTVGTQGQLEGENVSARPWFTTASRAEFFVGLDDWPALTNIHPRVEGDHQSRVTIAVSVPSEGIGIGGMVVAVLNWEWARNLQLSVVPNVAYGAPLGATLYFNPSTPLLDSGVSGWASPPDAPDISGGPPRGWLVENIDGAPYLTGYARSRTIEGFGGTGWAAFVRQPVQDLLAPVAGLQRSIASWAMVFLLPLLIAAWIIAGRFSNRLDVIARAADRVREGDSLATIPRPPGEGELSRMCQALDEMVVDLRARRGPTGENHPPVDPRYPV